MELEEKRTPEPAVTEQSSSQLSFAHTSFALLSLALSLISDRSGALKSVLSVHSRCPPAPGILGSQPWV